VSLALERIVPALARAAAAFLGVGVWRTFGYARAGDHARERFGRSGRWLRDLAALGMAFEKLPGLADAVASSDGGRSIGRVAASIIARVAEPESVRIWVDVARAVPVRSLREMAARARREGSVWPPVESSEGLATTLESDPGSRSAEGPEERSPRWDAAVPAGAPHGVGSLAKSVDDIGDDETCGVLVRLMVPAPLAAAFDEALDLYRAMEGSQASVAEFVDAMVADSQAGPHPADAHAAPLGSGRSDDDGLVRSLREKALARSTGTWKHLAADAAVAPDWAFGLAGMTLAALGEVCSRAGTGGPVELDDQIRALIRLEDDLERRLARLLTDLADQNAWARLRFDSVGHYAEQRLGMSRSSAQERVRAQRGLARLPVVRAAYERCEIGLEATLRLVRILERDGTADEERQRAWVLRAREATCKRLREEERLMARKRAMASRRDEVDRKINGGAGSRAGEMSAAPVRPWSMPPDDVAWQASLRRTAGTARRRIAVFGRLALENLTGDTFFRLRLPADLASAFLSCVESSRARLARAAEEVPWDQPLPGEGDREASVPGSLLCARMFSIRCRRSPAWVGLLAMLEDFTQTWDDPAMSPDRPGDAVYIRDGWRCAAPGCTSRRNLESHHIVYRSRGGDDDLSNLTCLCRFHHQMGEHGDLASCRGVAPLGILWSLGRHGVGGRWRNEIRL